MSNFSMARQCTGRRWSLTLQILGPAVIEHMITASKRIILAGVCALLVIVALFWFAPSGAGHYRAELFVIATPYFSRQLSARNRAPIHALRRLRYSFVLGRTNTPN